MKVNENEIKVLTAVYKNIQDETGGDFGFSDGLEVEGLTAHQIAGYLGSLEKKNLYAGTYYENSHGEIEGAQTQATVEGIEWIEKNITNHGFEGKGFEVFCMSYSADSHITFNE